MATLDLRDKAERARLLAIAEAATTPVKAGRYAEYLKAQQAFDEAVRGESIKVLLSALALIGEQLAEIEFVKKRQRKLLDDAKGTVEKLPNTATLAYWAGVRDCVAFWDDAEQAALAAKEKSDG